MKHDKKNMSKSITLKILETQLRSLPHFEPQQQLKQKLLAAIGKDNSETNKTYRLRWWPGAVGLGTAAAVVLVMAMIFLSSLGPSAASKPPILAFTDQNNTPEPCELQRPIISQNEPAKSM